MSGDDIRDQLAAELGMYPKHAESCALCNRRLDTVERIVMQRTEQLEADLAHARSAGESYRRQRDALRREAGLT